MLIADVKIFLSAYRADDPAHPSMHRWLTTCLEGGETFGISELVLSAFVRISTNRRILVGPATPEEAIAFCAVLRTAPSARIVAPGQRHWDIFADLVRDTHATANIVPDAYLAALAIEHGATLVTRDRGLRRFPGLRTLDPLTD